MAMNKIRKKTKSAITAVGLSEKSDQNFLKPDLEGLHSAFARARSLTYTLYSDAWVKN